MAKKLLLQDIDNRPYEVIDVNRFMDHLTAFHTDGTGEGDHSIHEENGYYFRITPDFYREVKAKIAELST